MLCLCLVVSLFALNNAHTTIASAMRTSALTPPRRSEQTMHIYIYIYVYTYLFDYRSPVSVKLLLVVAVIIIIITYYLFVY